MAAAIFSKKNTSQAGCLVLFFGVFGLFIFVVPMLSA